MLYVVTPVHNRKAITRAFLTCLRRQTFADVEIVIVDDGSTDGTSSMILEEFPEVTLLYGDGNLWWSGATNVGLRHVLREASDEDFVLVINDDVLVDPTYLEDLIAFARQHPDALVGSVIAEADNPDVIWDGGRRTNWFTAKHEVLNRGARLSAFPETTYYDVSQLTGRGMLARVSVFRQIGLYDAESFRHRGDTELPVRASRAGYRLLVFYGACVWSLVDESLPTERAESYRLRDFHRYFLDFRSSGWIVFRYRFARRTATSPLQLASFLTCDIIRVSVHFFRGCMLSR